MLECDDVHDVEDKGNENECESEGKGDDEDDERNGEDKWFTNMMSSAVGVIVSLLHTFVKSFLTLLVSVEVGHDGEV